MSQPCGREGCETISSLRCSACKFVWYCHFDCQRKDWKVHRVVCRKIKASKEDLRFLPHSGMEEIENNSQDMEQIIERMSRIQGINASFPRYHDEYKSAFPQEKSNIARLMKTLKVSYILFTMVASKNGICDLAGYGTLRQLLLKRWHFTSDELLAYLNSQPKPGDICSIHPFLQEDTSFQYGQNKSTESERSELQMMRKTVVHKKQLKPGKHVSVGSVDLLQLLHVDLAPEGKVEWHWYEINMILVARARLIMYLLTDLTCPDEVILQIWLSSLLSKGAETWVRNACKKLAVEEPDLKTIYRHWAVAELSCKSATTLWSHNITTSDMETVGVLAKKVDRVFYAHYMFNGDLFLADAKPSSGNVTLLSIPGFLDNQYRKDYNSLFHTFCTDLYSESLEKSIEKSICLGLQKLRKYLMDEQLTVLIHMNKVDSCSPMVTAEIRNMAPLTIDWYTIPDFMPPGQFENLVRSVSASHTTHTAHFTNWKTKVFGTAPYDFLPFITGPMLDQRLEDSSGRIDLLCKRLVVERQKVLKNVLPKLPFLHQDPTLHTANFMNAVVEVLAHPFKQDFVKFYFRNFSAVTATLEQPVPNMERLNPLERSHSVLYVSFKMTENTPVMPQISRPQMKLVKQRKKEGDQFFQQKKYKEAVSKYTDAIILNPDSAPLYEKRSACYLKLGQPQQALEDARNSTTLDSSFTKGWGRVARSCALLGDVVSARQALSTFEELGGDPSRELKYLEKAELELNKCREEVGIVEPFTANKPGTTVSSDLDV